LALAAVALPPYNSGHLCGGPPVAYLYLAIAILAEVIATSTLKATASFSRPLPSLVVLAGYGVAFYFMSLCLKSIKVGVVYAVWSGLGIVLVNVAAAVFYKQIPDGWAIAGLALIVAGVLVLNLLSQSAVHQ
jgi:small multidrug resistance pump